MDLLIVSFTFLAFETSSAADRFYLAIASTAVGQLSLSDIAFTVDSHLLGLQGEN